MRILGLFSPGLLRLYILLLFITLLLSFLVENRVFNFFIFIIMLTPFLKLLDFKKKKTLLIFFISVAVFEFFMIFTIEYLRPLFLNTAISENKIIGYAHYFGYPLYFDSVIYTLSVLFPSIAFILLKKNESARGNHGKNN